MSNAKVGLVNNDLVATFIHNRQRYLFLKLDIQFLEFLGKCSLICDFAVTGTQIVMHRHTRTDNAKRQVAMPIIYQTL